MEDSCHGHVLTDWETENLGGTLKAEAVAREPSAKPMTADSRDAAYMAVLCESTVFSLSEKS